MPREYRYAMYNRPVWEGLSLSQPYTLDFELTHPDVVENRKYYNRDAHSILTTNQPLTADEIRNLEMVDITADNKQRAHKAKLIEYINTLDGVSDSGKRALIGVVETGTRIQNRADVDKWADKYMAQGTRSNPKSPAATPKPRRTSGIKYTKFSVMGKDAYRVWTADMTDYEDMTTYEGGTILHKLTPSQSTQLSYHRPCELTDAQSKEIERMIAARSLQKHAALIKQSIEKGTHNGYVRGKTYHPLSKRKIAFGDYIDLHFVGNIPTGMQFPLKMVSAKNYYSTAEYKTCVEVVVKDANGVKYSFKDAHLYSPSKGECPSHDTPHEPAKPKQVNIANNPYGTGYVIQLGTGTNMYMGDMRGGTATFETVDRAVGRAERLGYEIMSKPKATKPKRKAAPTPLASVPVRLGGGGIPPIPGVEPTPPPAAATKPPRTPAPSVPAIFAPAPAAASDPATVQTGLGGGIPPIPGVGAAAAPKPKRKTAAKAATKKPKPPAKAKSKPKKTAAKPAKGKAKKPAPAGITLTAAQKKRLAAKGSITIKRDGKFVTITR